MSETLEELRQYWDDKFGKFESVVCDRDEIRTLFAMITDQRKTERRAPITIAEMRSALEVERDMPFSAPEIQLEEFKKRLRM